MTFAALIRLHAALVREYPEFDSPEAKQACAGLIARARRLIDTYPPEERVVRTAFRCEPESEVEHAWKLAVATRKLVALGGAPSALLENVTARVRSFSHVE